MLEAEHVTCMPLKRVHRELDFGREVVHRRWRTWWRSVAGWAPVSVDPRAFGSAGDERGASIPAVLQRSPSVGEVEEEHFVGPVDLTPPGQPLAQFERRVADQGRRHAD